jgi:hypothetical protein
MDARRQNKTPPKKLKRFHYDDHDQLRRHLADFVAPTTSAGD